MQVSESQLENVMSVQGLVFVILSSSATVSALSLASSQLGWYAVFGWVFIRCDTYAGLNPGQSESIRCSGSRKTKMVYFELFDKNPMNVRSVGVQILCLGLS